MTVQEYLGEKLINCMTINGNLLVATVLIGAYRGQLQSVERAFAGQCLALVSTSKPIFPGRIILADHHSQQRIVT